MIWCLWVGMLMWCVVLNSGLLFSVIVFVLGVSSLVIVCSVMFLFVFDGLNSMMCCVVVVNDMLSVKCCLVFV